MNRKITSRIDLNIGMRCNIKCQFCYYLDKIDEPFKDFDELVCILKSYRKKSIDKLHITGGEPTLYKDLIDLIKKSKQLGFTNIGIITNGIILKNRSFIIKCKDAGIDSFSISIHGHNAIIHDELTQSKGSYEMIMKGIENLKELEIPFTINSVVTSNNYKYLKEFSELMIQLNPEEIALLYFNPMDCASASMNKMSEIYTNTIPYLNDAIDLLEKHKIKVFYKFIPFCVINKGYEKNLANLPQALFEDWEWNYKKRFILYIGYKKYFFKLISNFKKFTKTQINNLPFKVLSYLDSVFSSESYFYVKLKSCKECKYDFICQGINKYYLDLYGIKEFVPINGEKIIKPEFFLYNDPAKISIYNKIFNNILYAISRTFSKNKK